jgi:hypothetical protein
VKHLQDVAKAADTLMVTLAGNSQTMTSRHQRCRSMCNTIRAVPKLKAKYWGTWEKFGDGYHRDCPDGPQEQDVMRRKIQTVSTELAKFKASYVRDLA